MMDIIVLATTQVTTTAVDMVGIMDRVQVGAIRPIAHRITARTIRRFVRVMATYHIVRFHIPTDRFTARRSVCTGPALDLESHSDRDACTESLCVSGGLDCLVFQ